MKKDDKMDLDVGKLRAYIDVICMKCFELFNMRTDGDKYWIVNTDKIPWVRCKTCYGHPDDVMHDYTPDSSHQLDLFR